MDRIAVAGRDSPVRRRASPRGLLAAFRRLSALVTTEGADLAALTALLSAELGVTAAVVDTDRTVVAAAAPGTGDAEAVAAARDDAAHEPWARVLTSAAATGRALRVPGTGTRVHVVAPVVVADEVPFLVVTSADPAAGPRIAADGAGGAVGGGDDVLLLVSEHAATVAAVLAARRRVLAVAAGQVRADLVSGLVLGRADHPGRAAQWAEHLGYDPTTVHRVLLVLPRGDGGMPGGTPPGLLADAEEQLGRLVPGVLTVVRDTELVAVLAEPADPTEVGAGLARRLARGRVPDPDAVWPVTVAVGGPAGPPTELARSYDQARRTGEAARRLGREGRVLRFDDLGVHRLLLQVPDPEDARVFAREVLGRLVTDRSERTADLLRTLARYFRCDSSPQRTARALSVHPNTVGYRLRRAEELSGLSLESYRDRLAAQVALEILGLMEE